MTGRTTRNATEWLLITLAISLGSVAPAFAQDANSPAVTEPASEAARTPASAETPATAETPVQVAPAAAPAAETTPQGQSDTPSGPSSDPRTARARSLFQVGLQLLNDGLFADALRSFQESVELVRRPRGLRNIAECFRGLGRHRDARETFDAILREFPNEEPEWLLGVRRARTESAGKIATYTITGLPAEAENVQIRIDGAIRDMAGPPFRVELDPGRRVVEVRADGYQEFRWEDRVPEADIRELPVQLEEIPEAPSIVASPWFWVVTGVVIAAGAAVGYYFLDKDAQLDGQPGTTVVNL